MKLENGRVTILFSSDPGRGMSIELTDNTSGITFAHVKLNSEQTCQALGHMGLVRCDMIVAGLDKIGKVQEHKKLEFEIPQDTSYGREEKKAALALVEEKCPEGWEADLYFDSRDSFFRDEKKKRYARTTIRRWVDKTEAPK